MAIDGRQVASAHGEYKPQPGDGTVQYHRVPAHRTPSDVVADLGVQVFPETDLLTLIVLHLQTLDVTDCMGKQSQRLWRLLRRLSAYVSNYHEHAPCPKPVSRTDSTPSFCTRH